MYMCIYIYIYIRKRAAVWCVESWPLAHLARGNCAIIVAGGRDSLCASTMYVDEDHCAFTANVCKTRRLHVSRASPPPTPSFYGAAHLQPFATRLFCSFLACTQRLRRHFLILWYIHFFDRDIRKLLRDLVWIWEESIWYKYNRGARHFNVIKVQSRPCIYTRNQFVQER